MMGSVGDAVEGYTCRLRMRVRDVSWNITGLDEAGSLKVQWWVSYVISGIVTVVHSR